MRIMNKFSSIAMTAVIGLTLSACTDGQDWETDGSHDRLFGQYDDITVEKTDVEAVVSFKKVPNAEYYIIEISTDSLYDDIPAGGTAGSRIYGEDKSITESPYTLTGLAGDTRYYLRMKSMSATKESYWSYYNDGKTFRTDAEQIFIDPVARDRSESTLHVAWIAGSEVTDLVVTESGAEESMTIALDDAAKAAAEYTITGLKPSTSYTIVIMNGEAKRGTLSMSTTAAMPDGDYKIELPAETTVLDQDMLDQIVLDAQNETGLTVNLSITIGLPADRTIDVRGIDPTTGDQTTLKLPDGVAITFFGMSGGEKPIMNLTKSIDIGGGHGWVRFENVELKDGGCQYVINQSTLTTTDELSFKEVTMTGMSRSLVRLQGSEAHTISKLLIDNCVITDQGSGGYALMYFNNSAYTLDEVTVTNSTFNGLVHCFVSCAGAVLPNINVSDCTFYDCIGGGRYLVDANGCNTNVNLSRIILGKVNSETARGIRTSGQTTIDQVYQASDCVWASNAFSGDISGRASADIFTDPDNGDFTLKITDRLGDPRWYMAE